MLEVLYQPEKILKMSQVALARRGELFADRVFADRFAKGEAERPAMLNEKINAYRHTERRRCRVKRPGRQLKCPLDTSNAFLGAAEMDQPGPSRQVGSREAPAAAKV